MKGTILLDTGPLVAFLKRDEKHHSWAKDQFGRMRPPLMTCESVISEACFLLARHPEAVRQVLRFIREGILRIGYSAGEDIAATAALMHQYRNVPMSFADACLVRMAEIHSGAQVCTLDDDFRVYRKNRRHVIPLIAPLA